MEHEVQRKLEAQVVHVFILGWEMWLS